LAQIFLYTKQKNAKLNIITLNMVILIKTNLVKKTLLLNGNKITFF